MGYDKDRSSGISKETPDDGDNKRRKGGAKTAWMKNKNVLRKWEKDREMCMVIFFGLEKWEDAYDDGREARVKAQAYWAVKLHRCPTQWNNDGGSNGSVSVSSKGAAKKEAARPAYQTQYSGRGDSVETSHIGHGISAADRGSSGGWKPPLRWEKGGNYHKEKVK